MRIVLKISSAALILFALFAASDAQAVSSCDSEKCRVDAGTSLSITGPNGVCYVISNPIPNQAVFVPIKTSAEWVGFYSILPRSGVTKSGCYTYGQAGYYSYGQSAYYSYGQGGYYGYGQAGYYGYAEGGYYPGYSYSEAGYYGYGYGEAGYYGYGYGEGGYYGYGYGEGGYYGYGYGEAGYYGYGYGEGGYYGYGYGEAGYYGYGYGEGGYYGYGYGEAGYYGYGESGYGGDGCPGGVDICSGQGVNYGEDPYTGEMICEVADTMCSETFCPGNGETCGCADESCSSW